MAVLSDLINQVRRRVMPTQRVPSVILSSNFTANGTSISFTDNSVNSSATTGIQPGAVLAVDLELFYVNGVASGGSVNVIPGYLGSTSANHTSGAIVYINPKFSDFDILTAINNDLDDLCSTENGIYHLNQLEITYNPVITQYDLTDINGAGAVSGLIDIIAIRAKTPWPDRKYRAVLDWELIPFGSTTVDTNFPSGFGLQLNNISGPYPGQPMLVIYKQQFVHLVNYTDNVQTTALLPATCNDLPVLGAAIQLMAGREIERNQLQSQPDPRLASEVPPGAVTNSVGGLVRLRQSRIMAESARLRSLNESRMRRR